MRKFYLAVMSMLIIATLSGCESMQASLAKYAVAEPNEDIGNVTVNFNGEITEADLKMFRKYETADKVQQQLIDLLKTKGRFDPESDTSVFINLASLDMKKSYDVVWGTISIYSGDAIYKSSKIKALTDVAQVGFIKNEEWRMEALNSNLVSNAYHNFIKLALGAQKGGFGASGAH